MPAPRPIGTIPAPLRRPARPHGLPPEATPPALLGPIAPPLAPTHAAKKAASGPLRQAPKPAIIAQPAAWRRQVHSVEGYVWPPAPLRVHGMLPKGLRGTLRFNGPGRVQPGEILFDHQGLLQELEFGEHGITYTSRPADTEKDTHGPIYGCLGRRPPGIFPLNMGRAFKPTPNTNCVVWDSQALALNEGCLPHRLGAPDRPLVPEAFDLLRATERFTAHPKLHLSSQSMLGFAHEVYMGWRGPKQLINLYRFGAGGKPTLLRALNLGPLTNLHDFALTDTHAIFFSPALKIDVFGFLGGWRRPENFVTWTGGPTRVVSYDLQRDVVHTWDCDKAFFPTHVAAAYDNPSDGSISVSLCEAPGRLLQEVHRLYNSPVGTVPEASKSQLLRLTLRDGKVADLTRTAHLVDFPRTLPGAPAGDFFGLTWGNSPLPGRPVVIQGDAAYALRAPADEFFSEGIPLWPGGIPGRSLEDAYVLSIVSTPQGSEVRGHLGHYGRGGRKAELFRARLPFRVASPFHGSFQQRGADFAI